MKIRKKEGLTQVRLEHNKILFWVIVFLLFVLIGLLIVIKVRINNDFLINQSTNSTSFSCNSDLDCVPSSCCHASSCSLKNESLNCSSVPCTLECKPNTLDCGQAKCICYKGKCGTTLVD